MRLAREVSDVDELEPGTCTAVPVSIGHKPERYLNIITSDAKTTLDRECIAFTIGSEQGVVDGESLC